MRKILAFAAFTLLGATIASAGEGSLKASCTQEGKIVYRADLPVGTSATRRLEIAAANPRATCVFLKDDPAADNAESESAAAGPTTPVVVGDLTEEASGDLATALAYISQGNNIGRPYGEKFSKSMEEFLRSEDAFVNEPDSENTVNLTIAVYKNAEASDITQHWDFIRKNTKKLGKYPPTVQTVGDVTVLNVEKVGDKDAAEVCEEAEKVASGCMAVY